MTHHKKNPPSGPLLLTGHSRLWRKLRDPLRPSPLRERLLLAPVRFYQKYLSRLKPFPTCRFTPCCSTYAATALRRFGLFRGGLMALCRILRCNPLCKGGVDPVPHHFTLRPFAGLEDPEER